MLGFEADGFRVQVKGHRQTIVSFSGAESGCEDAVMLQAVVFNSAFLAHIEPAKSWAQLNTVQPEGPHHQLATNSLGLPMLAGKTRTISGHRPAPRLRRRAPVLTTL